MVDNEFDISGLRDKETCALIYEPKQSFLWRQNNWSYFYLKLIGVTSILPLFKIQYILQLFRLTFQTVYQQSPWPTKTCGL